ncbi:MAG: GNAT family N-acetyltransferase [Solirubrobacteraceae bacterium]
MSGVGAYLRQVAAGERQLLATGCFDAFIDPDSDHPADNYAIPRDGAEPGAAEVAELIAVMEGAARMPRLEFLPAAAPAADVALREAGFTVELRTPVMTCVPDGLTNVDVPENVTLHRLRPDAPGEELHGLLSALAEAFGDPYDPTRAEAFAATLLRRTAILAYAGEEIAGGGMSQIALDGTTELVGIGVLEPFRRRGIAAAVTCELARLAFAHRVTTAFLTPGDEATAHVYSRCGFEPADTMVHLIRRS